MTRNWFGATAVAAIIAAGVITAAAAAPGDLDGYMAAHRAAVVEQRDATTDPAVRAALQHELDAIDAYLGTGTTTTTTGASTSTSSASSSTTTTLAPTTTTSPPTTQPPTTTTVPATTIPATTTTQPPPNNCGLRLNTMPVTFCDTFSSKAGMDPATRSGDLNAEVWGVSRTNSNVNQGQQQYNVFVPATMPGCSVGEQLPPQDVKICNGRMVIGTDDDNQQPVVAAYPKQPFDIAGRTGTIGFDVSSDAAGTHAAWPEFWWTDQPVPAPHIDALPLPVQSSAPRNSIGFSIAGQCGGNGVTVDQIMRTTNYRFFPVSFSGSGCMTKGSATGALNHVEMRISTTLIEIWGTDAGSSTLELLARATNPQVSMTRGLPWVENVHYNAGKFDNQKDHAFAFDNFAYDGPRPYRDLSFDVPDAGQRTLGWKVTSTPLVLRTVPVYRRQTPTGGLVTFNWFTEGNARVPDFRLNGGPWHATAWPFPDNSTLTWRTMGVSVPVSEIQDGVNTVEMRLTGSPGTVSNVNVILIAGAP